MLGPRLEVDMSKKCTPFWREAHVRVKSVKTDGLGPLLEVDMSKKCTPLCREGVRSTFGRSDVVLRGRHKGVFTWSKVSKT